MSGAAEATLYEACPFDTILNRTPYFVLPKLAIQAMPMEWRKRFAALIEEANVTGLACPSYIVLRDEARYTKAVPEDEDDPYGPIDQYEVIQRDPWAEYRHARLEDVQALCLEFTPSLASGDAR